MGLENSISTIKSAAPPFVSSPQLMENIRSFVVAVLLSSKLSAYKKDSVPIEHVMTLLTAVPRTYVPENLAGDAFALKTVKGDIGDEFTQARAKFKKLIKQSIVDSESIFDLTTAVVANSKSSVSVPLCARLALLRKVYVECSDATFWNKVDGRLTLIRTMADGDAWKITKAFEHILQSDRNTYGDSASYTLPDNNNVFQNSVDDLLAGTH